MRNQHKHDFRFQVHIIKMLFKKNKNPSSLIPKTFQYQRVKDMRENSEKIKP